MLTTETTTTTCFGEYKPNAYCASCTEINMCQIYTKSLTLDDEHL